MSAATTRHRSSGSSNVCGRLPRRRVARASTFVDEAAPPKLLRALSQTLIERGLTFSWLTNIQFERVFANPTLIDLMARAGCISVSGGLETASDRLLELMDKGRARLPRPDPLRHPGTCLSDVRLPHRDRAGDHRQPGARPPVLPTGLYIRSPGTSSAPPSTARWPAIPTATASVYMSLIKEGSFARHVVPYEDPTPYDHERICVGFRRAGYHFNPGLGLDRDVRS